MRPLVILCVLLLMLLSNPHLVAQSYYPDQVGDRWVFRSTDGFDTKVNRITGQVMYAGKLVTVAESQTNDNPPDILYATTEDDAVWIYYTSTQLTGFEISFDYTPPQIFIPTPLIPGTTWTVFGETLLSGEPVAVNNVATVVGTEDVVVPAGTFHNTFKILQTIELRTPIGILPFERFMWLAPNVGIVKEINTSEVVFELVEYELTPPDDVAVQPASSLLLLNWADLKAGRS